MSVILHQNWNEAHQQVGRLVEHLEQVEAELEKARERIRELESREPVQTLPTINGNLVTLVEQEMARTRDYNPEGYAHAWNKVLNKWYWAVKRDRERRGQAEESPNAKA